MNYAQHMLNVRSAEPLSPLQRRTLFSTFNDNCEAKVDFLALNPSCRTSLTLLQMSGLHCLLLWVCIRDVGVHYQGKKF